MKEKKSGWIFLKKTLFSVILICFAFNASAQALENQTQTAGQAEQGDSYQTDGINEGVSETGEAVPVEEGDSGDNSSFGEEELSENKASTRKLDFMLGLFPSVYINTESKLVSAPSPFFLPLVFGVTFPRGKFIQFAPTLSVFYNYFLVYNGLVLPAEIENRTGLGFSFLLNIPVVFNFSFNEKSRLELMAGLSFLFRFALLASGVDATDSGYLGTAAQDVAYMNRWYYQNLRFLYLSLGADYLFEMERINFGPSLQIFLPIAGFFADRSAAGIIVEAGMKVTF